MITHLQITFPQHPGQAFPIAASNGLTLPVRARSDVRKGKGYPIRILTRAEWDDQNKPAGPYLAAYQPMRPVPDVDFEAEDGSLHPTAEACLAHELRTRFNVESLDELWAMMKALADKAKLTVGDVGALTLKLERRHFNEGEQVCIGTSPEIYRVIVGGVGAITVRPIGASLASPMEVDGAVCRLADPPLYDSNGNPPFSGVPTGSTSYSAVNAPTTTNVMPPLTPKQEEDKERERQWIEAAQAAEAQPSQAEAARLLASAVSQRGLKVAEAAKATGLTPAQVRATAKSLPGQFATNGGRVFLVS